MRSKKIYKSPQIKVMRWNTNYHLMLPDSVKYDDGTIVDDEAAKGVSWGDNEDDSNWSPWSR